MYGLSEGKVRKEPNVYLAGWTTLKIGLVVVAEVVVVADVAN